MNHVLSSLLALTFTGVGVAETAAAELSALAGDYRMQGKGFALADSSYLGTCSLRGDGPAYDVSCFNADTRHTYVGRGLADGETLAIFIGDSLRGDHGGAFVGEYLVLYRRQASGALEGTWIATTSGAAGRETLTPVR